MSNLTSILCWMRAIVFSNSSSTTPGTLFPLCSSTTKFSPRLKALVCTPWWTSNWCFIPSWYFVRGLTKCETGYNKSSEMFHFRPKNISACETFPRVTLWCMIIRIYCFLQNFAKVFLTILLQTHFNYSNQPAEAINTSISRIRFWYRIPSHSLIRSSGRPIATYSFDSSRGRRNGTFSLGSQSIVSHYGPTSRIRNCARSCVAKSSTSNSRRLECICFSQVAAILPSVSVLNYVFLEELSVTEHFPTLLQNCVLKQLHLGLMVLLAWSD